MIKKENKQFRKKSKVTDYAALSGLISQVAHILLLCRLSPGLVPWVCLQFVIVVFSDHTHSLFLNDEDGRLFLNSYAWSIFPVNQDAPSLSFYNG